MKQRSQFYSQRAGVEIGRLLNRHIDPYIHRVMVGALLEFVCVKRHITVAFLFDWIC